VGSAVDPEGGRRIVLVIIGMITVGSVEDQTTNLMPQRFLISYPAATAMPACEFPAWRIPEGAKLCAVSRRRRVRVDLRTLIMPPVGIGTC
jgi:hypothetical protein